MLNYASSNVVQNSQRAPYFPLANTFGKLVAVGCGIGLTFVIYLHITKIRKSRRIEEIREVVKKALGDNFFKREYQSNNIEIDYAKDLEKIVRSLGTLEDLKDYKKSLTEIFEDNTQGNIDKVFNSYLKIHRAAINTNYTPGKAVACVAFTIVVSNEIKTKFKPSLNNEMIPEAKSELLSNIYIAHSKVIQLYNTESQNIENDDKRKEVFRIGTTIMANAMTEVVDKIASSPNTEMYSTHAQSQRDTAHRPIL